MSGPEGQGGVEIRLTAQEIDDVVKHIDGKNLEARNCTLDTVKLVRAIAVDAGASPEDWEKALQDIKFHFAHNRDGIIQFVEGMLRGSKLRKFSGE